ncbi:hypothetical protein CBR_g304 [Chara braunii]|uniref:Uncharacterized protein n=1 Tax=Chara braunii TaxID=69332 RepID=A0A388JQD3_CHABU|nr:hypothetical protein CBR_g304 [Chara braunii]|eukprot:GBG59973.1 hypothetical protein CBR_g304 [Chara braunii]
MEDRGITGVIAVIMTKGIGAAMSEIEAAMIGAHCPHPRRYRNSQPSSSSDSHHGRSLSPSRHDQNFPRRSSSDPIHSKVAEIGKSVAVNCQYVENEQQKKAVKESRRIERKEAEECEAAERLQLDQNRKEEEDKARKNVKRIEEINKNVDIKVAVRVGELREDVREDVRQEVREAINELSMAVAKGKQKVVFQDTSLTQSDASSSETEELELRGRTRNLCISEKCKREPEPIFEDSPPMELPPKRYGPMGNAVSNSNGGLLPTSTSSSPQVAGASNVLNAIVPCQAPQNRSGELERRE